MTDKVAAEAVEYLGPYDEVELPLSPSETKVVKKGEAVRVSPDVAENLKAQGTWAEPKPSHRKKEED